MERYIDEIENVDSMFGNPVKYLQSSVSKWLLQIIMHFWKIYSLHV